MPQGTATAFDTCGQIVAWEQGELEFEEVIELFQNLVDTGLVWQLQGCYGRTAMNLIESGHVFANAQ